MSATHVKIPKYCHHKARDKGYVALNGRVLYLPGPYGSAKSRAAYDQHIAEWVGNGRSLSTAEAAAAPSLAPRPAPVTPSPTVPAATLPTNSLTVGEVVLAYLKYAKVRHAKHGHFYAIAGAFKPMVRLFRHLPITEFGPKRFKEVRQALVNRDRKLKRREINNRMRWIRNGIKWAVGEEMIPGEVLYRLNAVDILRRDEAAVPESENVCPVDESLVLKTIQHVSPEVAAMARIQMLTGARSGEVCQMKAASIDRTKDVWLFRPEEHKTKSRGKERVIPMGRRAQEIIRPFLIGDPHSYIFSPAKAEERRLRQLHAARKTPIGQGNRLGTNKSANPAHSLGDRYTAEAYGRAITRGIRKAFPLPPDLERQMVQPTGRKKTPRLETHDEWWNRLTREQRDGVKKWWKRYHWHPHQLRHSVGTVVRDRYGVDFSQALLGHASLSATQVYAELNKAKAIEVVREIG